MTKPFLSASGLVNGLHSDNLRGDIYGGLTAAVVPQAWRELNAQALFLGMISLGLVYLMPMRVVRLVPPPRAASCCCISAAR